MFGDDNAFAYNTSGTESSVGERTLGEVKAFYASNFSASVASVIAVSDLNDSELLKALQPFSNWEGGNVEMQESGEFPKLDTGTIYFLDKPGAAQSEIRIGKRSLPFDATGEYYRATLMNYSLGGAFNSRINLNLREDKGYTYGARSFF